MIKFPKHSCGLFLTHNEHKDYYEDISDFIINNGLENDFKDEEDKQKSIATNELWVLQWYPDTPIGFYRVAGPSLESVLYLSNLFDIRITS